MFSTKKIIIIEAKVRQEFQRKQVGVFKRDRKRIERLIEEQAGIKKIDVYLLALGSSKHQIRLNKIDDSTFDGFITWGGINHIYKSEILARANRLHGK